MTTQRPNPRPSSVAQRSEELGLRLIRAAGSLEVMKNPELRARVSKLLHLGAKQGFAAQVAAESIGRRFTAKKSSGEATRVPAAKPRREFDLTPTQDQEALIEAVRQFGADVIRPAAAAADTARTVPAEIVGQAAELGLGLVGVPSDLGGIAEERSAVTSVLLIEELAHADLGVTLALMAPAAVANAIAAYGSADQQATFLPAFTDGEGEPLAAALAMMEPQPLFDPLSPAMTAERDGDDLVLNGVKALVPLAGTAELFVVSALLDGAPHLVLVEGATAGLVRLDDPAMGLRAAATGRLVLDGVRVPAANVLGTTDDHLDCVRRARLAWAAAAVGTGSAVLDHVSGYVKERVAFGEPIAQRQSVAFAVADIAIEVAGLRLCVWRAASLLDRGADAGDTIGVARTLAATHAARIGSMGVQLLGGHGFVKEFDNERWFRDLQATGLIEGALAV